jgi:hypothetical protein
MELRETHILSESVKVDPEAGVIRGAKLIGRHSKNGREYSESALAGAIRLYEGAKVFTNHPRRGEQQEDRDVRQWVGSVRNPLLREDGIYGDIQLIKSDANYAKLIEVASDPNFRKEFGLSHVAEGETAVRNGRTHVDRITEVRSVDLVTSPATTAGLFESTDPKTMTIKKLLESIAATVKGRKTLVEMTDADPAMAELPVEVAADTSPEDQIRAGIMSAVMSKLETADEATLKKVLKALGVSDSVTANLSGEAPAEETTEEPAAEEKPTEESVKLAKKLALLEAKNLLLESGREATPERVTAVALMPEAERPKLVESWPAKEALRESGLGERPQSSPPANGGARTKADDLYESRWKELAKRN